MGVGFRALQRWACMKDTGKAPWVPHIHVVAVLPTGASNTLHVANPSACYKKGWLRVTFLASIWGMHRDTGKENGNYYSIYGLYRDNGKENGNYYLGLGGLNKLSHKTCTCSLHIRAYHPDTLSGGPQNLHPKLVWTYRGSLVAQVSRNNAAPL